jgi:glycosyltransferase involved in cell wall biosynthesis
MRIAMFRPGLDSASLGARVHQDFEAIVEALGHRFRILTTERAGSPAGQRAMGQVLPLSAGWRRADELAAPWLKTRAVLSPAASLARHLKVAGREIDLLHVEMAYPFGVAATLAAAAAGWKGPIVITPMGEDTLVLEECRYGFRRHAVPRALVGWALRRVAGLRCISPLHEREIARLAPNTPRRVIPLNVSDAVVEAADESPESRAARRRAARRAVDAELGWSGRPLVLSLGRLHPFKGIDRLIGALRRMPDAKLLVAGPSLKLRVTGDEASRLAQLVQDWKLDDRIRFLGPVTPDRAMQLMAAADVVAVPSLLESLNKVCVEAAAVGTPFVVTETTGISAWARDAGLGVVIPPNDEDALARAVLTAIERPDAADPERLRTFVRQFSPQAVAAAVIDFYLEVAGQRTT